MEPDTKELVAQSTQAVALAEDLAIGTQDAYLGAVGLIKGIKELTKKVEATFKPILDSITASLKATRAQKDEYLVPLTKAEGIIKQKMVTWDDAERRRLAEEQAAARRRQEEAEKEAKEKAALLEEVFGDAVEPVAVPLEVVQAAPEKVSGVSYTERWSAEVVDLPALIAAAAAGQTPVGVIVADMTFLNGMARALKGALNIPGVKAVCTKTTNVRA